MTVDASGPLAGLVVAVTRPKAQAAPLGSRLEALGARSLEIATIEIAPPADGGVALAEAAAGLDRYDRIVVASPNAAQALATAIEGVTTGAATPQPLPPVACVGPGTASVFEHSALDVDVVPGRNVAEGLVDALGPPAKGADRLLLVQAEVARDTLERGLTAAGWVVDRVVAYRTVDAAIDDDARRRLGAADVILFTSSSTVERFVRLVGLDALPPTVASIGPITSSTAGDLGVHVDVEADPHTIAGLVDALAAWAGERNSSA